MNTFEDTTQTQTPSGPSQTRSGASGGLRFGAPTTAGCWPACALASPTTWRSTSRIVRVAFAVFTFLGGAAIPAYLACLLLIPEEGSDQSLASSLLDSVR